MFHVYRFQPHTGIVLEGFGVLEIQLLIIIILTPHSWPGKVFLVIPVTAGGQLVEAVEKLQRLAHHRHCLRHPHNAAAAHTQKHQAGQQLGQEHT